MKAHFLLILASLVLLGCKKEHAPTADFSYTGTLQNFTPIHFTNLSTEAQTYNWDFGDGMATSSDQNPNHTFRRAGTYSVTLTAVSNGGTTFKTQVLTLHQADTTSLIITDVTGNYRFTKKYFYCYGSRCTGPRTEPCDTTIIVSRAGNKIQLNALSPTLPLVATSNTYYYFFSLLPGSVSAASRLAAEFKRDTDSLVITSGSGGSGGGYTWMYYGKRVR